MAVDLVVNEARWLPLISPMLPVPVPTPIFLGEPAEGFPWPWTIVPYLPGSSAALSDDLDTRVASVQMGEFLRALHRVAPRDAPANPFRGVPLLSRDAATRENVGSLGDMVDQDRAIEMWDGMLRLEPSQMEPRWLHGDLHPHNVLAEDGKVSAIIDFGDITSGDPATDLAVGWMMFDDEDRASFWAAYGNDDGELWRRSKGWALSLGAAYVAHSADNPVMHRVGVRTLAAVLGV
jgi:aminoglycoside phosphotransferase (APT) family kinase protein